MAVTESAVPASPSAAQPRSGSRLSRNIAYLAGGQLATWGLSLLWTIFVPRALGPKGLGELTIAYASTGVVSVIVSLGIGTLMVKEIARDHAKASWLVGTAIIVRIAFVVPAVAAVALYINVAHFGTEQALVIWLATGSMVLALFTGPFQAVFQAIERMEYLAYADVLTKSVVSIAGVALVLMGFGVVPLMALALSMAAVVLVLNVWWSRQRFRIDLRLDRGRVSFLVVDSLPYWTTGLVLTFYMWIDSVMLSFLSSNVVVGYYAVPTKLFTTLLFVPVILATAWLPRLSASFRDGIDALTRAGRPALELVLVLSLPVAVGLALVARPLIKDVYGVQFGPSVVVLTILAATLPPTYFNIMANQVLVASNRQIAWTKVMIAAAVANPLLNLALIPYFQTVLHNGAVGAAVSLLATEIGMAVAGLMLLPPMLGSRSVLRLLRAVLATAGMGATVYAASRLGLIAEITIGISTFAVLAVVLRVVSADEFDMIHSRLAWLPAMPFARADRQVCAYGATECRWLSRTSKAPCASCRARWV